MSTEKTTHCYLADVVKTLDRIRDSGIGRQASDAIFMVIQDIQEHLIDRQTVAKYSEHVAYQEGVDFLRDIDKDLDRFSEREWSELQKIASR